MKKKRMVQNIRKVEGQKFCTRVKLRAKTVSVNESNAESENKRKAMSEAESKMRVKKEMKKEMNLSHSNTLAAGGVASCRI